MRITIPTKFSLLNRTYSVRWATSRELRSKKWEDSDGDHSNERAEITLRPGLNHEYTWHVFLHELFHALFEATGHDKLSDNEDLVDNMGGALHQFLETKKGTLRQ